MSACDAVDRSWKALRQVYGIAREQRCWVHIDVTLGADYRSEVLTTYTPELSPGTMPKNSGVAIPNITDGFDGTAPDRGAIIDGRPTPLYGDR